MTLTSPFFAAVCLSVLYLTSPLAAAQVAEPSGTSAADTKNTVSAPAPDSSSIAVTPAAATPVTANITLASQYVSRGFRQTWGKPALQGGFDYVRPDGFFAGTWLSNVSSRYIENGSLEWDVYGGYAASAGALGYSATALYYHYPDAVIAASGTNYDYGELALGLTYQFLYAKYNYTFTRDYFGITDARGTGYFDLGANYDLGSGYTLNLHYGIGRVASKGSADNAIWNWKDSKIGISKTFKGGWTLAGAYTKASGATNVYDRYTTGILNSAGVAEISNPAAGTLIVSLAKAF